MDHADDPIHHIDTSGRGPDDPGMEQRVRELEKAVARIDGILPTLATKADLADLRAEVFKAINAQTWKLIASAAGLVAIVFYIARNVHP